MYSIHYQRAAVVRYIQGMRAAVLFGAVLLAGAPLWAQTSTVRIRVTDAHGAAIPGATVSLMDRWNRTVRTLSTNTASEIIWKDLPLGDWYFYAGAPGFYPYRVGIAICDGREQTITAQLKAATHPRPEQQFLAEGPGWTVEAMPAPYCQTRDLPSRLQQTKPAKNK
jgi:Carboxypeptidase regulatory-like domain